MIAAAHGIDLIVSLVLFIPLAAVLIASAWPGAGTEAHRRTIRRHRAAMGALRRAALLGFQKPKDQL